MNTFSLYLSTVLIWGTTWFAIKLQLGIVEPAASVTYRFAIAALVLLAWCALRRKDMHYSPRDHLWIAVQGFFLFSANYYVFYLATQYLTTGLVAVAFSTIMPMNILFAAIFFKTPVTGRVLAGAALGLGGLALVFLPEIESLDLNDDGAWGLALSLLATGLASLGNMASARNQRRGLPVLQTNAWGMTYGAVFMFVFTGASGVVFTFDASPVYISSLLYLALFGSVLAFGAYLTLLGRIGAGRASYAMVLFPLVALGISIAVEGYTPAPVAILGAALVLVGNVLVLARKEHFRTLKTLLARTQ